MKFMNRALIIGALALFSSLSNSEIVFQGFASFVGGATLDNSDSAYLNYENQLEFDNDSLYALQASSDLGDGLTVTGQLMARGSENYKPEFEWMYLSYNLTPTLNTKVGRIRTPFYMFSEYLEVGYTYHWIRPPKELYAAQVTNMDGISFLYNMAMGGVDAQYQVVIGAREDFDDTATTSDYKPLFGANAQFEMGNYTTKIIYTQGNIDFASAALDPVVAAFASDPSFQSAHANLSDSQIIFSGAALDMNFNPIRVLLEISQIDFEEIIFAGDETRMLASIAYSMGSNVFHYSWSSNEKEENSSVAANLAAPATVTSAAFGGITQAQLAAGTALNIKSEVTTHTLGLRHDFHDSAAFKVELISTEDSAKDTDASVLRFGVDMLF